MSAKTSSRKSLGGLARLAVADSRRLYAPGGFYASFAMDAIVATLQGSSKSRSNNNFIILYMGMDRSLHSKSSMCSNITICLQTRFESVDGTMRTIGCVPRGVLFSCAFGWWMSVCSTVVSS